ncbi:LPXTG cell wall anchor domain-containing protein [Kitasatospora sp. NPDC001683]
MRPARLPAACTLLVLTIGPVALATVPALAADTPATTPAAPTGTPSATPATPAETPSATPTAASPSSPASPSSATSSDCPEGTTADPIPVTSSSDAPGELAVTFANPSTTTVKQLATTVALADADGGSLPLELRAGAGLWKPLTVTGTAVNTGSYQLPQGQKLTLQVRLAAGAPHGDHRLTFTAKSEVLPSGSAPAKKYTCPQLTATYTAPLTPTNHTPAPTRLADTGAGTASRPLAIAGATALLLGTTLLFLTRRRPTTD